MPAYATSEEEFLNLRISPISNCVGKEIEDVKMRDNTKNIEYYNKLYAQDTRFLKFEEEQLEEIIEKKGKDFETIPNCYGGIADNCFLRLYLSYTMGKSYEELLPDARKYIENGIKSCNGEPYGDLERIIYVTILFDLYEYKDEIKEIILKFNNYQDKYMEELFQLIEHEFEVTSEKLFWINDCKALDEIIKLSKTDKNAGIQRLKKYIDNEWYKTLKEGLITNSSRAYRGVWCIEAAALVKALKLDDTELKDSKYYPYDMAHFCD